MLATLALAICAAACVHVEPLRPPLDLSTLEMDAAKFLQITLRDEVVVTVGEIRVDKTGLPNTRWLALEYVEHENQKGFVPSGEMEFTNLYLVSQVERLGEGRAAIKERYLVINLWHYYPSPGVKTCHVWTIWDGELNPARSRATFRLLVEDFNNTFLGERQGRLDDPTIDRLTEFYGRARAFLSKGARSFPLADQSPERDAIALRNRSCRVPFFTDLPCLASPRVSDAQRCLRSAASLT